MKKRFLGGVTAAALALSLCLPVLAADPAPPQQEEGSFLTFDEVETRVKEQGTSYLILEENIRAVQSLDYNKMEDDLRDSINLMGDGMWTMAALQLDSTGIAMSTMRQSFSALEDAYEDLRDGELQKDNDGVIRQLRDTQNQLIASAQTLYVALLGMHNDLAQLDRSVAAAARTAREMELRYERGQISQLQLTQVKDGQAQLDSARDALERNIQVYTVQLQLLLGMELTGELTLAQIPGVTDEELAGMDYQRDLALAMENSYTLYDAGEVLAQAEEDYRDDAHDYGYNEKRYEFQVAKHTRQAAQYTYDMALLNYEAQFYTAYTAVGQYRSALDAARSALALEEQELAAQELKYRQGNLSENALLTARDEVESARAALTTAEYDLFTAWLTYRQAVELGILH